MKPVEVPVAVCGECPFAWDGTELEDRWRCLAVDFGDHFKALPRGNPWEGKPPGWCPLRAAPRLVSIRRPPKAARRRAA